VDTYKLGRRSQMLRKQLGQYTFWQNGGPEALASAIAFIGLATATFVGFNPATSANAGSDFKTLFASSWCFAHGINAYSFGEIANVFIHNGVVEPRSWYGHAPVYPPPTLALLLPITTLPMVAAVQVWIALSAICLALGTASLAHSMERVFNLKLPLRILVIGLVAASPLVSTALELGNVSIVTVALCFFAVASPQETSTWLRALGLVVALLLKPHIAIWVLISLIFSRVPTDRIMLRRAVYFGAGLAALMIAASLYSPVVPQFAHYNAMLHSELSSGSMSPGNRDLMELPVQMTSFVTLPGYWFAQSSAMPLLSNIFLLFFMCGLAWACSRAARDRESVRFEMAGAWSAFGLMATYHRNADGTVLLILLPPILARLRQSMKDGWAWAMVVTLVAGSIGPSLKDLQWLTAKQHIYNFQFLLLRQAALATVCVALLLLAHLALSNIKLAGSTSYAEKTGDLHLSR
jgi:hypothetical protein